MNKLYQTKLINGIGQMMSNLFYKHNRIYIPTNMTIEETHVACQDIVYQQLQTYQEKIELYQSLYNTTQSSLTHWSLPLEEVNTKICTTEWYGTTSNEI